MALMPSPAASANGKFATTPMAMVMMPAMSAVPAEMATTSAPVRPNPEPRMLAFRKTM